jgi:tripartite-type tricarboxylate transporter receptor subunit TctC
MKRIVISTVFLSILFVPFILNPLYSWCAEDPSKYPSKPITFILPVGPGGAADLLSRTLAELAGKILNTSIVVENKPGGAGVIGLSALTKSSPDGYTIAAFFYNPTILTPRLREVPYKTKEDFDFIIQFAEYTHAFVVKGDAPWKSFKDFVEDARKRPGELTFSTPGPRTLERVFIERIANQEKIKLTHVPYGSNAEQITAVLGGHTSAGFIAAVAPHIIGGSLRALAVEAEQRWEIIPDVPTFKELGYTIKRPRWIGIAVPKGVPENILKTLEEAFTQAYNNTAYQEMVKRLHMTPVYRSGADFRKRIFEDFDEQGYLLKSVDLGK